MMTVAKTIFTGTSCSRKENSKQQLEERAYTKRYYRRGTKKQTEMVWTTGINCSRGKASARGWMSASVTSVCVEWHRPSTVHKGIVTMPLKKLYD